MLLVDVNVLIYAHRPESPEHDRAQEWLTGALEGGEPLGVSELVLSGFLRVVTNHRVYREPSPVDVALAFCDAVREGSTAVALRPGPSARDAKDPKTAPTRSLQWFTFATWRRSTAGGGDPEVAVAQGVSG